MCYDMVTVAGHTLYVLKQSLSLDIVCLKEHMMIDSGGSDMSMVMQQQRPERIGLWLVLDWCGMWVLVNEEYHRSCRTDRYAERPDRRSDFGGGLRSSCSGYV